MKSDAKKKELSIEIIELGLRLQAIISQKNLKIREVAHDADLDVENLRKYLKGRQEMKVGTMLRISRALGVEVGELFNQDLK